MYKIALARAEDIHYYWSDTYPDESAIDALGLYVFCLVLCTAY